MNPEGSPTVVLAFDGLAFEHLDAFAPDLPHLSSLRERGVDVPLRSTFPPWTGSAWPSMYTGVDPSHHGIYDFFNYDRYPDTAEIITRNDVRALALWDYLTAVDVPSVVLNMPVTCPTDPINGALIPGYLSPEDAPGYPAEIRDDLEAAIGEYRIYSRAEMSSNEARKLAGYAELIDIRRRAAAYLLSEVDWELAIVQVQKTDAVFHNFSDSAAFRRVYRAADELVGTVLDTVDETANVIVCSDHGIGSATGFNIYVNEVLRDHGLVETATESKEPSLGRTKQRLTGATGESQDGTSLPLSARAISTVISTLSSAGVAPGDVHTAAQRLGVEPVLTRLMPTDVDAHMHVDWSESRAYCRSESESGVRINLEGRDPDGVVPSSAYEDVCSRIVRTLGALKTPDGNPAFEFVKRREEVYDGPYLEDACDILFLPREMNNTVSTTLPGKRFVPVDTFNHKRNGVFVGAGPGLDTAASLDELSLTDVAPIVMALLGYDVPVPMTGSVPNGLLRRSVSRGDYPNVEFATGGDDLRDDRIEQRLADLGYL